MSIYLRFPGILPALLLLMLAVFSTMTLAREVNITEFPYYASPVLNDNGPLIQLAIDDLLAEGGGTLYIPAGEFKFSTPIYIHDEPNRCGSIIIRGDGPRLLHRGKGTDLIFTDRSATKDALTVEGRILVNGQSNPYRYDQPHFTLRDLALSGGTLNEINYTLNNRKGLALINAYYSVVENVLVNGFKDAGIYIDNAYYSSVRDSHAAYCGIGVDCVGANAVGFYNVATHYCHTAGFRNPQSLIRCTIEGNFHDGIIYTEPGRVSIHDCYFESNNLHDQSEGADIYASDFSGSNGYPTVYLNLSGTFTANGHGTRTYPYRYLRGGFRAVMKNGVVTFAVTDPYAMVNLTKSMINECSSEPYPDNLSWTTATDNVYKVFGVARSITNIKP